MPALRRSCLRAAPAAAIALLLAPATAAAEPEPPASVASVVTPRPAVEPVAPAPPRPAATGRELTAADVAFDPVPGFESGRLDREDGDSAWRQVGRGLLYVPRLAIDAALTPARAAIYANDHYHVTDWYYRIFFNDDRTIGLYPLLSIDTTLGVTAGGQFVDRDLFGEREQLALQASIGTRNRQIVAGSLGTGDRLGDRFSLGLDARYERRPADAFYGIGNGDRVTQVTAPGAPAAPIDPRVDSTAMQAYYGQVRSRLVTSADLRLWQRLHLRGNGEVSQVEFAPPHEGTSITQVYDPRGLVGWGGYRYGYGELELRWDNRHGVTSWEPASVLSAGELAAVFVGREHRLDQGTDFWRYGLDLQKFLRIAQGPRVVIAHFHGEAVSGSRDQVPFTELPALGGPNYLRGYDFEQFRDRVAAFASLAYEWDLSQWFSARLFTDVGRVFPAVTELSVDHLRMGYGLAIEAHSVDAFAVEASIGSSIDGGVFLNLSFSPVYNLDERVRRR
jgi:hypothetical protein